jgi:PhzF family phenazine biosynthesis protein
MAGIAAAARINQRRGVRTLRYFQVDAFTSELFKGNPAGVCVLEGNDWLPDELMQRIAFENNLSETAFLRRHGKTNFWLLRWFTPAVEIDLCGHATLASAFVLFNEYGWRENEVEFVSSSGLLSVERKGPLLELDFPSRPAAPTGSPEGLITALGCRPDVVLKSRDWMAVFESAEDVLSIKPDFKFLAGLPGGKIIVTAPGEDVDFVSRFFAPGAGVDEDPVTGSSHCTLIPYWAERLGKTKLHARQLSTRGGELFCVLRGDRVGVGGHAVLYSSGQLHV